jgi:hypothetical protein
MELHPLIVRHGLLSKDVNPQSPSGDQIFVDSQIHSPIAVGVGVMAFPATDESRNLMVSERSQD